MFEVVANITAHSLEEAHKFSCASLNPEYEELGIRDTVMGDIIIDEENDKTYFIDDKGYIEVMSMNLKLMQQ